MLSCYGDESADETKQRVFAAAGVVGQEHQWSALEEQWNARTAGIPFHANDCESDQGDYKGRPHAENQALYKDLTVILANSGLAGYGFAVDLIAQKQLFPLAPDIAYYKCFVEVLGAMYRFVNKYNESIKFTFDTRLESDHNAGLLYGQIIQEMPEWKARFFPEISFVSSNQCVRVQVADLLARETMKSLDNMVGPVKRKVRKSLVALHATNRFMVEGISREWFEDLNRQLPQAMKRDGLEEEKYRRWLRERKRQHSVTNLFVWLHSTTKMT